MEITKEESDGVDSMRYAFNKLKTQAVSTWHYAIFHLGKTWISSGHKWECKTNCPLSLDFSLLTSVVQ